MGKAIVIFGVVFTAVVAGVTVFVLVARAVVLDLVVPVYRALVGHDPTNREKRPRGCLVADGQWPREWRTRDSVAIRCENDLCRQVNPAHASFCRQCGGRLPGARGRSE